MQPDTHLIENKGTSGLGKKVISPEDSLRDGQRGANAIRMVEKARVRLGEGEVERVSKSDPPPKYTP